MAQISGGGADAIAIGQWGNDTASTTTYVSFAFLAFLVLVFTFLMYLSRGSRSSSPNQSQHADNLFLGVKFDTDISAKANLSNRVLGKKIGPDLSKNKIARSKITESLRTDNSGYLRELAMDEASFVSSTMLTKSDGVTLHLSSLPNYPDKNGLVKGEVFTCRAIGGEPESYLVKMKFSPEYTSGNSELAGYLNSLSGKTATGRHPA